MSTSKTTAAAAFTPGERDYILRELDRFVSTLPSVADGFQLRTWRGGSQAGQPKVPLVAKGLLERGLMRIEPMPWPPRLFFTEAGLAALRAMMADRRFANPKTLRMCAGSSASTPAQRSRSPGPSAYSSRRSFATAPCPARL